MKRTIVIYDNTLSGHHLEYIHHLYCEAIKDKIHNYVFALPSSFTEIRNKFEWKHGDNVVFDLRKQVQYKSNFVGKMKNFYNLNKDVKNVCTKHRPSYIFFILIEVFMPLLPFVVPNYCKIAGIIYQIYLFEWKSLSIWQKFYRILRYLPYKLFSKFETLYILNSEGSARMLNHNWHISKFKYLPDPITLNKEDIKTNISDEIQRNKNERIFLQFGALSKRKGCLKILESIGYLTKEQRSHIHLVFAGVISDEIKKEMIHLAKKDEELGCRVTIFDEFCSYEKIAHLVSVCDCIMMPYSNTSQSSGLLGYAVVDSKPVIIPRYGMLGKLGKESGVGIFLDDNSSKAIAKAFITFDTFNVDYYKLHKYLDSHSVSIFNKVIFNDFRKC